MADNSKSQEDWSAVEHPNGMLEIVLYEGNGSHDESRTNARPAEGEDATNHGESSESPQSPQSMHPPQPQLRPENFVPGDSGNVWTCFRPSTNIFQPTPPNTFVPTEQMTFPIPDGDYGATRIFMTRIPRFTSRNLLPVIVLFTPVVRPPNPAVWSSPPGALYEDPFVNFGLALTPWTKFVHQVPYNPMVNMSPLQASFVNDTLLQDGGMMIVATWESARNPRHPPVDAPAMLERQIRFCDSLTSIVDARGISREKLWSIHWGSSTAFPLPTCQNRVFVPFFTHRMSKRVAHVFLQKLRPPTTNATQRKLKYWANCYAA